MENNLQGVLKGQKIAYFSMEIGLRNEIPTYSGGLGVLAGDTIRSAADLNIPLVAVTLVSNKGYFRQKLDASGTQTELTEEWTPSNFMTWLPQEVSVKIQGRDVKIQAWHYNCKSLTGGCVPIIFLDTNVEGNSPEDRRITDFLYGGDHTYRLKQEIVLGVGGVRMLNALGFKIRKYHMNEGHSSLLALELLKCNGKECPIVKDLCIFTTHTPVEAGHDKFDYSLVEDMIRDQNDMEILKKYGGEDRFNTSLFALNLSDYVNGVTKRHSRVSSELFPGYSIQAITNGVHSYTWTCPYFRDLFDRYMPGWANEPELLVRIGGIPDDEIWEARRKAKKALIDEVNKRTGAGMEYETFTIGFARRMTAYKRATLLLSDIERLRKVNRRGKIQIIFAGKAHPRDEAGKQLIRDIFKSIETLRNEVKIVFLENYDMDLAAKMVSGVDLWLNTPTRPYEASGTSGMKAAHNGVVNFSILDGWWIEGWIEGVTGWSIGPMPEENLIGEEARVAELNDLYNKLYYIIVPMYYERKDDWLKMMNNSIGMIAYYFNSHRMMRRYVTHAYL
ncbi:alpha-glucan family phosphorylase [Methanosarcina mazei]|jgi:starch phosphorylase|uniref:Glycogen phosphorylase n=2 Tax=Methanosarcina mazei TaxID=2209 RepID=A0A0E3RJR2_METMZ|nr:alpha-glucan family phosphorylase [Methanosarcina mazei]AAM32805.1 Glycogen phosphorylase [Methanosarcina mazei Go1]AKB64769.1 Glycogen phosphorylase [Methanosarcina mazei S-6]